MKKAKPTHIRIFDFDETLFRVPSFTCSQATGMKPYDWFDNPKSLDSKTLNIVPILNTIEKAWDKDFGINYLITHRAESCKEEVLGLLDKSGCQFEKTLFLGRTDRKALKLLEILDENPQIKSLEIFEDSLYEVLQYAAILEDADLNIPIIFVIIDMSKVIKLRFELVRVLLMDGDNVEKLRLL